MDDQVKKKILIVDDSEIDREILTLILEEEYEIVQALDGFDALERLVGGEEQFDVMMLDVQMPGVDGFGVLRMLNVLNIDIPVALITSEATKVNVAKAARWSVNAFFSKPFDRTVVLARVHSLMIAVEKERAEKGSGYKTSGLGAKNAVEDIEFLPDLIKNLESIAANYFKSRNLKDTKWVQTSQAVGILMKNVAKKTGDEKYTEEYIDMVARAAYFCDLGQIVLPDSIALADNPLAVGDWKSKLAYKNHTTYGAEMIGICTASDCREFVDMCVDLCQNHHERIDGKGFPRALRNDNISIEAQCCGMAVELLDLIRVKGGDVTGAIDDLSTTIGNFGQLAFDALSMGASELKLALG